MNHLVICREYPPVPGGGIGTYVQRMSRLLAEAGETVHVIAERWPGAGADELFCSGRLIIHRIPALNQKIFRRNRLQPSPNTNFLRHPFSTPSPAESFSWNAALLAEELVETEDIRIIEAQEYDAPLYYFQLRRALGLGPRNRPPCLLHLHSPTWLIARHNDWDLHEPWLQKGVERERFSITAADALLCPSRHLAGKVEMALQLPTGSTTVIPYPLGDTTVEERNGEARRSGSICYVGRLERRKGVLEWIDAAVRTLAKHPDLRFDFVGANVLGINRMESELILRRLIPSAMTSNFRFHGPLPRNAIPPILSRARIAVVPSRWDNFPNSCMEAMSQGVPVIATREGGMAEMITDGLSGWLANVCSGDALAEALARALGTTPETVMAMGEEAARAIGDLCGDAVIIDQQLELRRELVQRQPEQYKQSAEIKDHAMKNGCYHQGGRSRWSSVRSLMMEAALAARHPGVAVKVIREKVRRKP